MSARESVAGYGPEAATSEYGSSVRRGQKRQQPIRGFGKVWRDHEGLRDKLGWATAKETAQPAEIHAFERGTIMRFGPLLFITVGVDTDQGTWY